MATEVILPRVDMDMVEAKVAHWYFKDGDTVKKGQVLFEIETDKATMEVDAAADGTLNVTNAEIDVAIPVGQVIGWILAPGEAAPASGATPGAPLDTPAVDSTSSNELAVTQSGRVASPAKVQDSSGPAALLRATPLARSLAREHVIDLRQIQGSGPDGRILGRDMQAALGQGPSAITSDSPRSGLHLQWVRRGSGTPLLLIHGFGADQGSWRPLLQHLPADRAVVAVDLPNHGKSAASSVRTLQDVAAQVSERLDAEGIAAIHLLGHSLGGAVALALTRAAPERVQSLTLLAPAGLGADINGKFIDGLVAADDEGSLKETMGALFHDPAGLTGSFVATAFQQLQAPGRRDALSTMARQFMPQGRQSENLREVLAGVRVPAQVIWGTDDRIVPMQHGLDLPAHVGLHLLPSVGHLPQVEAAALVAMLAAHQIRAAEQPA